MIEPIVSAHWLQEHYDVVSVCDVRAALDGRDAWKAYLEGHLPGAVHVDLESVLSAGARPILGRHPLPDPAHFAKGLGALGIGDDATVVAYDDMGGAFAARLVWMLRVIGQQAALLDGGLSAWKGVIDRGQVSVDPVSRTTKPWPAEALADAVHVEGVVRQGGLVIDSRAGERYRGEVEPIDARAGHIPGAINLPFADNLGPGGRFAPVEVQRRRFDDLGVDADTVVYCGSGVTACHNILAIEATGLPRPRLYVGSWSGWSSDPDRPVATGSGPG